MITYKIFVEGADGSKCHWVFDRFIEAKEYFAKLKADSDYYLVELCKVGSGAYSTPRILDRYCRGAE